MNFIKKWLLLVITMMICVSSASVAFAEDNEGTATDGQTSTETETATDEESSESSAESTEAADSEDTEIVEDSETEQETDTSDSTEAQSQDSSSEDTVPADQQTYAGITMEETTQTTTLFSAMLSTYSTASASIRGSEYTTELGIDVSQYQGDIDWESVAAAGIKFAIIKVAGRGYGSSGTLYTDSYYKTNLTEAKKYGIKVGAYFFSQAITEDEAVEEAEMFSELLSGISLDLPAYMDYEWERGAVNGVYYRTNNGASADVRTGIVDAFCETMVENGYAAGLYTGGYILSTNLNSSELAEKYRIWVASYSSSIKYYTGVYDMWQYSSTGTVDGISGNVDMDYWYNCTDAWPSTENKYIREFVTRLYTNCLGREPDSAGLYNWTMAIASGNVTAASAAYGFFTSEEFTNKNYSDEDFVSICYKTILNRSADTTGLSNWVTALDYGVSRAFVIAGLTGSTEFKNICNSYGITAGSITLTENRDKNYNITVFVSRCYKLLLERDADVAGLNDWTGKIYNNTISAAQFIQSFLMSDEYLAKNTSDEDFLIQCYQTLLFRNIDDTGKEAWMEKLENGVSRNYILKNLIGSSEFINICKNYGMTAGSITLTENRDQNYGITAFIARCYICALGRKFDVTGLNSWTGEILNASDQKQKAIDVASNGFFYSQEFINRNTTDEEFVTILYSTFLNREPDQVGYNDWVSKLEDGTGRGTVLKGFSGSDEFAELMASYGIE